MGCTLAKSAVINPEKDAQREWVEYGSESDSDEEEESPNNKWKFGAGRGHAERDAERAEEKKRKAELKEEEKKAKIKPKRAKKEYEGQVQQVLDSDFEDNVIQHVESTLTNRARKVEPFNY